MAGFEVTLHGRFWVTPEALKQQVEEWQALQLSNGFGKAADLPGVHRGRNGFSEAPGAASARSALSARA
jgi:hypothetical protein